MEAIQEILSFVTSQVAGLSMGIVGGFLANHVYQIWRQREDWKEYRSLEGTWVESNDLLEDRPFSICNFSITNGGSMLFEGHSYDNQANEYYKWWSTIAHIDSTSNRFSYIYQTHRVGTRDKDEGFGCIFLRRSPSTRDWIIERGYFLDLTEANPRDARMVRFETVAKHFNRDLDPSDTQHRKLLIKELMGKKKSPSTRSVLGW